MPSIFFLLGDARSGTTFLAKELSNKYELLIPPESNCIKYLLDKNKGEILTNKTINTYLSILFDEDKFEDWHLDRKELEMFILPLLPLSLAEFINHILVFYEKKSEFSGDYVGIKKNVFPYLDRLITLFPEMKLVGVIRDGRAVFASKKSNVLSRRKQRFENSAKVAAKIWVEKRNILREFEQKHPQNTIILKYEELLSNLDFVLSKVGDFFNLNRIIPPRNAYYVPSRYNKIHGNVGKKPIKNRAIAWKESLSEKEIKTFERIASKTLVEEEYELVYSVDELKKRFFFF